jgi:putative transposase
VPHIPSACVDGLRAFLDAFAAEFPDTRIQLYLVHMVRNSLKYVSGKNYKAVTADLKRVHQSATEARAR